ncbi:MAG: DUF5655 domain-containing protein [Gemmatimonadaceae bacterium]
MNKNVELIRYRQFGSDLLLLELVNATAAKPAPGSKHTAPNTNGPKAPKGIGTDKTVQEWLADLSPATRQLFDSLEGYVLSLGDDVQRKDLKLYVAFKRIKNFATVVFQKDLLRLYLRLDPTKVDLVDGLIRDVREIGHWGTGDVELLIRSIADLDRAKALVRQAHAGG